MAVQKSRKSRSRRGMRRAHQGLTGAAVSVNESGILHRRHHIAEDGTYRGKQIIATKKEQEEVEEEGN